MATDSMPTTEHVRAQYARQENYDEFWEGDLFDTPDGQVSAGEFDAWLTAHDAEVREAGRREGAEKMREQAAKAADEHVCEDYDEACWAIICSAIRALPTETGLPNGSKPAADHLSVITGTGTPE